MPEVIIKITESTKNLHPTHTQYKYEILLYDCKKV